MNNFSDFVNETKKSYDSLVLLQKEVNDYIAKVNKILPKSVQTVLYLTQKYNIINTGELEMIRTATKSNLKTLWTNTISKNHEQLSYEELESLWKLLKDIKSQYKLLPHYMTARQREAVQLGKLALNDLTIDLDSPQGRNAAAKIYAPLMYKIVNQFVGKSNLGRRELISAAMHGFVDAMNQWDRTESNAVSFKTYASYRIQQQILNDINKLSHHLSGGSSYLYKKYGSEMFDTIGLSQFEQNDIDIDKLSSLAVDTIDTNLNKNEKINWDELYKIIEANFKQRDCDIFYRYFGLNGYKREKSKDIARSMGMSEGNIQNSIIHKILLFLRRDKKSLDILQNLQEIYTESLISELINFQNEDITEALLNDDIFILLEDMTKWTDKNIFVNMINNALDAFKNPDKEIIINILKNDFNYLDDCYKKYKKIIILFLNRIHPTESFNRKSDVSILEYVNELQEHYHKFKL